MVLAGFQIRADLVAVYKLRHAKLA